MKEKIITISLYLICALSFLWLSKALLLGYYPDFQTQYFSSLAVFSGNNPYNGGENLFTPQVYPPTASFFYVPFIIFPVEMASIIFTSLSLASLIVVFILLSKTFSIPFFSRTNIILMTLSFIAFPTKFTLGMGQINLFMLLFIVLGLYFYKQKKEYLSGVFFGLSLAIKLFPLPLVPFLLFKKKMIAGGVISIFVFLLLVFLFIPYSNSSYFVLEVLPTLFTSWKLDYYNQSIAGFLGRGWGVNQLATTLKLIMTIAVLGITYFAITKNKANDIYSFSLQVGIIVVASLLVNTFSWQHHFVWLIVPFYAIVILIQKYGSDKLLYIILSISYLLISINFRNPNEIFVLFQSHVLFGAMLLWLLNLRLIVTSKKKKF